MPDRETDRLRRLREQQLRDRDPLAKQRRQDREIARKQQRMKQGFSLARMWADVPRRWRGGFVGLLIGLLILLAAPSLLGDPWGTCLGAGAVPFAAVIGFLIGRYQDSMDEIRGHLH